jgi:hypothetical protein
MKTVNVWDLMKKQYVTNDPANHIMQYFRQEDTQ